MDINDYMNENILPGFFSFVLSSFVSFDGFDFPFLRLRACFLSDFIFFGSWYPVIVNINVTNSLYCLRNAHGMFITSPRQSSSRLDRAVFPR